MLHRLKFAIQMADTRPGKIMGTQAQAAPDEKFIASVARHPILDADEQVLGYELSFLQGAKGQSATADVESDTCTIIETL